MHVLVSVKGDISYVRRNGREPTLTSIKDDLTTIENNCTYKNKESIPINV